jgi:MoxR-like ATPase
MTAQSIVAERYTVTLAQAASLILACPGNRYFLRGEPGIGKSSIIKELQAKTGYRAAYIDCPNMDLGDIAMPVIDHETKTTKYYPNGRFQLQHGEPVIIMLDEFTKAADPVKNMLHPLLEVHNPRLGDVSLPAGSIVFLTGNLDSDGVGDSLLAHSKMRVTEVEVGKPDSEQWLQWASGAGIDPAVMAWVYRNPHALASYRDGDQESNPFIFHPNKMQGAVVTPRTLELGSNIVRARENFDAGALQAALVGTIGAAAAGSLAAFIAHQDSLPPYEQIIKHPDTTKVPEEPGALSVLVFGAIERIKHRDEVTALLKYFGRADVEWQTIFNVTLVRNKTKASFGYNCKAFADWVTKNQDLL